jgi:ArsR family transcriptional regulator
VDQYTSIFKALADPTRLRILRLLLDARVELCVCELVDSLEEPQYNISKHVNALKVAGLLESRKDGRWVYYRPTQTNGQFLSGLAQAITAIPSKQLRRDRREFEKRLKLREGGKCLRGVQKEHLLEKVPTGSANGGKLGVE